MISHHPVHHIVLRNVNAVLENRTLPPWQDFRPTVWVEGDASVRLEGETLVLESGQVRLQFGKRHHPSLRVEGGEIQGQHPGGDLTLEGGRHHLYKPSEDISQGRLSGLLGDLGAIAALTALLVLIFSPLFLPPRHLDYLVIVAASLYLGLGGGNKRALISSCSIGVFALLVPPDGAPLLSGSLNYALKLALYLVLWGAGKKLKDWYRGSVS